MSWSRKPTVNMQLDDVSELSAHAPGFHRTLCTGEHNVIMYAAVLASKTQALVNAMHSTANGSSPHLHSLSVPTGCYTCCLLKPQMHCHYNAKQAADLRCGLCTGHTKKPALSLVPGLVQHGTGCKACIPGKAAVPVISCMLPGMYVPKVKPLSSADCIAPSTFALHSPKTHCTAQRLVPQWACAAAY